MKTLRYKNIFLYASLQFCGNIEEYFAKYTQKLIVFIVMPRLNNTHNILRIYQNGLLVKEKNVWSSPNFVLYYILWYTHYLFFILSFYSFNEKFFVISFHPISFIGMSLQRLMRKIIFVYYVGDYFPPVSIPLVLFEKVKKYYHSKMDYAYYLSDSINEKMNGQIVDTKYKKTIMWGVKTKNIRRELPKNKFSILFVGLVKDSEGLRFFYNFLKLNKNISFKIVGVCSKRLYKKNILIIKKLKIEKQVFFPNRFFSDLELDEISKECHIGVAFYDTSKNNSTYYTDPGKVKAYTELGLPVIMSNTSAIAEYIKKFKAGEVVDLAYESVDNAITSITQNYSSYRDGVEKFNTYFSYETYYKQKYSFLENS